MAPPVLCGTHRVEPAAVPGFFSFYEQDLRERYGMAADAMVSVLEHVLEQTPQQGHILLMEWYSPRRVTFSVGPEHAPEEWSLRYRSNEVPHQLPPNRSFHIDFYTARRVRSPPAASLNIWEVPPWP